MGTAVIEIVSDDEAEVSPAAKPPADALDWASTLLLDDDLGGFGEGLVDDSKLIQDFLATLEGEKKSAAAAAAEDDDDDDCVILEGDPDKPRVVLVKEEKKPGDKDGPGEEDLQVLGEKGEVLKILALYIFMLPHCDLDSYIALRRFLGSCMRCIDRRLRLGSCIVSRLLSCRAAIRRRQFLSVRTRVALTSCCGSSHTLSSGVIYVVASPFNSYIVVVITRNCVVSLYMCCTDQLLRFESYIVVSRHLCCRIAIRSILAVVIVICPSFSPSIWVAFTGHLLRFESYIILIIRYIVLSVLICITLTGY
jgi:hypothetical protein